MDSTPIHCGLLPPETLSNGDQSIYKGLAQHQQKEPWFAQDLVSLLRDWAERFDVQFKLHVPEIVLRVDSLSRSCYGHFRYGHNGFGLRGEVAINARYLNGQRPPWQILGTLLHELLHGWQQAYGTPGKGNYLRSGIPTCSMSESRNCPVAKTFYKENPMTLVTLRKWLGNSEVAKDTGMLGLLHASETALVRMVQGIPLFLIENTPEFWQWLLKRAQWATRILVRIIRVVAVGLLWLCIVFGALTLFPGIISGVWTVLAIIGSIWGIRREQKKKAPQHPLQQVAV